MLPFSPDRGRLKRFLRNTSGSYLIEAAILFPILLGISLAVIEFGFIFMREQTVKNYMAQMVQRIERGQINVNPVVTAMNSDPLLRNQNIQVCTTTASSCTGNSRINAAPAGVNVVLNVQRNYTPLTPVGNLMNFQIGTPGNGGTRTLTRTETVNTGAINFNCPAGQVLQRITNSQAICVIPPVNLRCPAGQVLQSVSNTQPVCVVPPVTMRCPAGQVLQSIVNTQPVCVIPPGVSNVWMSPTYVLGLNGRGSRVQTWNMVPTSQFSVCALRTWGMAMDEGNWRYPQCEINPNGTFWTMRIEVHRRTEVKCSAICFR